MTVTRFAPSPTGLLHLGHVSAAIFAHERARAVGGGRFLLRIEDIDPGRARTEYAHAIIEDLAWLGLRWDEPPRVQSARLTEYAADLAVLRDRGLIYPCFCTRARILREIAASAAAPHGPDGPLYPGRCRNLRLDERHALIDGGAPHLWRLDMRAAVALAGRDLFWRDADAVRDVPADPQVFGDVVLARRDAPASYHLCATHDDAAQGVTLVTRGVDLRPAAGLHRLLQALMGWPAPAYAHHPLLAGADGKRLSKRDGAVSVRSLRAAGHTPEAVLAMARAAPTVKLPVACAA